VKERVLELLVFRDGGKCRIVGRSPSGMDEDTAEIPANIRRDSIALQEALLRGATSRRGQAIPGLGASADEQMIGELGSRMYSFLFSGAIGALFKKSLADASNAKEQLRIKLRIEGVRELAALPWETLCDPKTNVFFAAYPRTPFTRSVHSDEVNRWIPKRLDILGMIAGPRTFREDQLPPLDVDLERSKMERALDPLKASKKATLSWTMSGSYKELRRRLTIRNSADQPEAWTVFHFIGHGDFDNEQRQQGYLIFEEIGGSAGEARYADSLAPLLTNAGGPQLVVLNSCNGARSATGDLFSSTAAALALAGVPAVIGMQFPVSDDMAIKFSSHLYEHLSEALTVQQALTQTRIDLRHEQISEWIAPVLYMQTDGELLTL
jgi:CHAT domain